MNSEILIVEDEEDIRFLIAGILSDEGYAVREAGSSEEAIENFRARKPTLIILDVWLKGSALDGIELLDYCKAADPDSPIIIISGHGTVETAVSAIRKGAYDYIVKPFKSEKLIVTAQRAVESARLKQENADLKGRSAQEDIIVGISPSITHVSQKIERIAPTNSRVLITAPSGAGKELFARLIHQKSARSSGPFKAVNAIM